MSDNFLQLMVDLGWLNSTQGGLAITISVVCLFVICYLLYRVAKSFVLPNAVELITGLSLSHEDELNQKLLRSSNRIAMVVPSVFCLMAFAWFVPTSNALLDVIYKCIFVYLYASIAMVLVSMLTIGSVIYHRQSYAKDIPIKGIIQIIKLLVFIVFTVLVIAELTDKSAFYVLSGLGALTAVLLLIFKDTILGFVAGIQIVTHRLVSLGDWIEMPKYGADGEVLEVSLHTVKICNWDKTITTVPTYALINESFKNWRGMSQSGGRRIKRAISLDIRDVSFIDNNKADEILAALNHQGFSQYVEQQKLENNNNSAAIETNIGLFRLYCEYHLQHHQMINQQMTLMARQLAPCETGIAIELYCFCLDKNWVPYEKIQAEIVEHLIALLPLFELRCFQYPSSHSCPSPIHPKNEI